MEKIPVKIPTLPVPKPPGVESLRGVKAPPIKQTPQPAQTGRARETPDVSDGERSSLGGDHRANRATSRPVGSSAVGGVDVAVQSVRSAPRQLGAAVQLLRTDTDRRGGELTPYKIATYGGALVLGMYVLKSYKEGGVTIDDTGTKRSVFRWIDAACGVLVAMLLINFARTVV